MGFLLEELMAGNDLRPPQADHMDDSAVLVFDDEPLERILYGKEVEGPTQANLFASGLKCVRQIRQAYGDGDIPKTLEGIAEFTRNGDSLSVQMCFELAEIARAIVPSYPNPVLPHDLAPVGPLLEQMWGLAAATKNQRLQHSLGTPLFRWYEHHERYRDARRVLNTVLHMYREHGDRSGEAIVLNNFAFEYLLEGRWQAAIPLFEQAATMFRKNGNDYECANSQANYWICRFECGDLGDIEAVETELKRLESILTKQPGWHARKPLILLAKIEERRGNTPAAIRLVERAIEACRGSHTRYPEWDANYLRDLQRRFFRNLPG